MPITGRSFGKATDIRLDATNGIVVLGTNGLEWLGLDSGGDTVVSSGFVPVSGGGRWPSTPRRLTSHARSRA